MGIQETVLALFQEQRIDKAVAYRLLTDCKKSAAAEPDESRVHCRLDHAPDAAPDDEAGHELRAMAAWVYLVHIASGCDALEIDCVRRERTLRLKLRVDDQLTPSQLAHGLRTQLDVAAGPGEAAAAYAWIDAAASSTARRQITASRLPDTGGGAAAAVALELRAHPQAQGATLCADWPETLQHFHAVMWREPDTRFAELDRLPPRHRRLIGQYNATTAYLPPARTLPGLLDPVLALEQDAVAVHTTRGSLSYRQYRQGAYRLAHLLRRHGVQRNDRVAVVMHRTARMPVALYGVICAGAAYVPLEPDMPADRIRGILRDTGARLVVTDADTLYAGHVQFGDCGLQRLACVDRWPRGQHQGLPVDDAVVIERCSDAQPAPVNEPGDICYVIYTSGSTGQPKGVMVSHLGIVNTLIGVNNVFKVGPEDRVLCFSSYGFDLSVWDIFGTALAGATLVLPSKPQTRDPAALMRLLRDAQVTIWDSAPTGMSQLLLPLADQDVEPVPSMRLVMLGGEFIQRSLPADIQRVFPNSQLANVGGATETTVYSICHYPVTRFEPHWKSIPYGRPLANQRFYVLNESLKPCAVGEKGMLYTGGLGVALGYLGDAERTRRAFIPAPWSDGAGEIIYRTGDLGIMRADGVIEICGRADRQVKLRGFRVELGEIESQLNALQAIDQGAVIAQRDASGQTRLVAFYVSRHGEIAAEQLRRQLAEKLPEYMIPSQFVHLADPPIGLTGKLDRKALERREVSRSEVGQEYVQPRGEAEQQLAVELARILRLDRVGIDDDFFLIGGDSLLTLQYLSVLSRLGFAASPLDIQQGRTIRGVLARVVASREADEQPQAAVVPFGPMSRKFFERLPLVDRDHWHQLMVLGFDHEPDLERLRHAMRAVMNHHALLRASCRPDGLHVAPRTDFELPVVDLGRVPWPLRALRLDAQVSRLRSAVTLSGPSLVDAVLVRLGPRDVRLLWVLHHLIVDANCWRILIDDLATAYRQPDARLLRSAPMADFVSVVRQSSGAALAALAATPRVERMPVPTRRPVAGPPVTGLERDARTVRLVLSPQDTRRLFDAIHRNSAVNLNLALLTALSIALRDWAGRPQVRFDIISNGRSVDPSRDYSRTIGWFATHNPFEVSVPDAAGPALAAVSTAWEHYQDYSRFFVEACNDARGMSGHPLDGHVDQALLYSFLGDFDSLELPDGWSILGSAGRNRAPDNPRTHELEMEALVARGCLMVRLVYPAPLMHRRTARGLLRRLRGALASVIEELEGSHRTADATRGADAPRHPTMSNI